LQGSIRAVERERMFERPNVLKIELERGTAILIGSTSKPTLRLAQLLSDGTNFE